LFFALLLGLVIGLGLWLSALNAKYRDLGHLLTFLLTLGMYASPVGYRFNNVPESFQLIYNLNPMVGIIEGFRWSLLNDQSSLHINALLVSMAAVFVLIWSGFSFFIRTEKNLTDHL
jgi:lipopolysaccharide transport system permease protein